MQLLTFAFFGAIATTIDWSAFYLTNTRLGWHYIASVTLSSTLGTLVSFFCNKYLTFRDPSKRMVRQLGSFVGVTIGGLFITYGLLALFIDGVHLSAMLSRMLATGVVFLYNYVLQRNFIFKAVAEKEER